MQQTCPNCANYTGKNLAMHWFRSKDCSYPEISAKQKEILYGLLLGDGCIDNPSSQNSRFILGMTNKPFIEYISEELDWLCSNVTKSKTAAESAKQSRDSGFHKTANGKNYSDVFRLSTPSHPELTEMREEWYPSGEKRYPDELELTPRVMKLWFVTDGYRHNEGKRLTIGCQNESDRREFVKDMFNSLPLDITFKTHEIVVDANSREKFFDYVGDPPDGFKYKWPKSYR